MYDDDEMDERMGFERDLDAWYAAFGSDYGYDEYEDDDAEYYDALIDDDIYNE